MSFSGFGAPFLEVGTVPPEMFPDMPGEACISAKLFRQLTWHFLLSREL